MPILQFFMKLLKMNRTSCITSFGRLAPVFAFLGGVALIVAVAVFYADGLGTPTAIRSYFVKSPLLVDSVTKSFGVVNAGETVKIPFTFTNSSNSPIHFLGARSSCSCVVAEDLPCTLASISTKILNIDVSTKGRMNSVTETLDFFTDCAIQPIVTLKITGSVFSATKSATADPRAAAPYGFGSEGR
jgi:hypothetical protein